MDSNQQYPGMENNAPQGQRFSWSEIWTMALTKPTRETYYNILIDPGAHVQRAYIWVFITSLISMFIFFYAFVNDPEVIAAIEATQPELAGQIDSGLLLTSTLCILPFVGILSVLVFMAFVWCVQFIAGMVGSAEKTRGRLPQIAYTFAAFYAPLNIISGLLAMFPGLGVVALVLWGYRVFLQIVAVQTVYDFDIQKATMTVIIPVAALFLLQLLLLGNVLI